MTVLRTGLPSMVVVTGPPASGKTTLARAIAAALEWPLFAKDDIKETLFDTLGVGDREWSRRLGGATMELLSKLVAAQLEAGCRIVVEANFRRPSALPPCRAVQVYCDATAADVMARIRGRQDTRHPGHVEHDPEHLVEVERSLREYAPLAFDGPLLRYRIGDDVAALIGEIAALVRDLR